ncbi:MAG: GNAT family N-acetyltransferase [Hydrogenophaga sp.]|uniref:GNAT family N-acetyltransferase n=1 Tax=Hydrogenophaga sp. TaxID=1904254 RepID=UPI0027307B6A|nr:GNAT family N-acetyltransferase [Hydrogenophaga sp.]MDP2249106.1 GNAT family N-acetyltransferase [Hydrogenophaga sp.]MDZ4123975.1 GNAT family N-acetyltransferase [Hydrogenophaga sp.]
MVNPTQWFKSAIPRAPVAAGDAASNARASDERRFPSTSVVVPIRSIGPGQRERILDHLLALEPHDRYLRFGYAANDEQITRYVHQLNFERDELFGIFNRRLDLISMAHLAFSIDPQYTSCAEFGVSVSKSARGRGYGSRLFERAVMHARNEGVTQIFIHALSENTAMLKIARHAGAIIERDGSESEAHLRLPPADFDSRVTELVNQQVALTDYHLKVQAKQFWRLLTVLQDIRQGVREARERARG